MPGVEELNKDQDRVLRLPENGQFLIVGGPGTGKSVVALLRAMKFADNKNYVFLTYNKVLNSATNRLTQGLNRNTLLTFFNKILRLVCNSIKDKLQKDDNKEQLQNCNDILNKNYGHNYEKIDRFLQDNSDEIAQKTEHLIIDEGQDMSVGYYNRLMDFGYENFFIVADQNQQITEENSSRQELTDLLGLKVKNVIELTQNYRNSYPIALVAQHFFTDIASPKPDLPASSKSALGAPILYQYQDFQKCIKFILREADRDPSNLIGVVVAKNEILEICKKQLKEINIELDNEKPNIQSYQSGQTVEIDFSKGGIVILNDKSIKGLEFDVMFVMLNGFEIYNNNADGMRKRLYVMSSRAIKKLIFFQSGNNDITELLPDETILLRQEIN
ncbi:ATP-dependent DNA helicase rep [uncultured Candidatus Thioglobus sp.]|nr:ATP-dependent DNA helicase rep [uncultured Candidatus Thioglobus sp.]